MLVSDFYKVVANRMMPVTVIDIDKQEEIHTFVYIYKLRESNLTLIAVDFDYDGCETKLYVKDENE